MEAIPLIALATLVLKFSSFLKYLFARDVNAAVTQLVVWVAGIGAVALYAASDFGAGISVGGSTLDALDGASLVLVGLSAASFGSTVYDVKKGLDDKDSAVEPPLFRNGG